METVTHLFHPSVEGLTIELSQDYKKIAIFHMEEPDLGPGGRNREGVSNVSDMRESTCVGLFFQNTSSYDRSQVRGNVLLSVDLERKVRLLCEKLLHIRKASGSLL